VGIGPILRIGENDKAPTLYRHIDQAISVEKQGRFAGLRSVELPNVRYWVTQKRH
jgi:hypothetical protein